MAIEGIKVADAGGSNPEVAADLIAGQYYQVVKASFGADGALTLVDGSNGLPVAVVGTVPVSGPLTDAQLRAAAVPVTGPLTDAELRASAVPISAAALPLPADAATQTTLAAIRAAVYAEDSLANNADPGVFVLAQRRDSDTSTAGDGDYTALKMDETGRLKVATQPGLIAAVTGSITASAQTVFALVERASNITISMVATSLVGHNSTFEFSNDSTNGSDGTWYGMQVVRTNANTIELTTGVLAATPAYGWEASVNAYKYIRVRATAHTSGTAAYRIQPGSYATEPIPAAQVSGTQPVSGTVTATVSNGSVVGPAAHDAAISGAPVRIGGRAVTTNYAAVATGDVADLVSTLVGAQIVKPFSIPELEFGAIDSITNTTTAVQIRAATASNQNHVTGLQIQTATLSGTPVFLLRSTPVASTTATIASNTLVMAATYGWKVGDLVLVTASTVTGLTAGNYVYILTVSGANLTFSATRGGSTLAISGASVSATLSKVLFRTTLQTTALPLTPIRFECPVSGGINLAIEAVTLTAVTGQVDINAQGFVAP
jgi:hypothetical protein